MIRARRMLALASAALVALGLTLVPAVSATSADGHGSMSGTITAHAGDQDFLFVFVPLVGDATPVPLVVHTDAGGAYSAATPVGSFHLLVTSVSGESGATWYNTGAVPTPREADASDLLLTKSGSSTVDITLAATPGVIIGDVDAGPQLTFVNVTAYSHQIFASDNVDRYPVATAHVENGSSFSLKVPPGVYDVVFVDENGGRLTTDAHVFSATGGDSDDLGTIAMVAGSANVERVAGADRFATAAALAEESFPALSTVFIVNGLNYPDALAASAAAATVGAPVLLVTPTSVPQVVKDLLDRQPDGLSIIIIGGTSSVSTSVATQLRTYSNNIQRISGVDRFETSRKVAAAFFSPALTRNIYLANGTGFADALSAGPAAWYHQGPVILVNGSAAHLDPATKAVITASPDAAVTIAGGPASVSAGIADDLRVMSVDQRRRQSGADRYETSARISDGTYPYAYTVYLAVGTNYPDALAGGAAAAFGLGPVLLVQKNCIPTSVSIQLNRLAPTKIYLLGGSTVISSDVISHRCP